MEGAIVSLADRLDNRAEPATRCSVGILIDKLEGPELEAFKAMLGTRENRGWSEAEIFEAVTAEGHVIGRQTVNRHRGGRCSCVKATS